MNVTQESAASLSRIALQVIDRVFTPRPSVPQAVRLWDDTLWRSHDDQEPRFTFHFRSPGTLRRVFLDPSELTLGQAYVLNDLEIEGDLESAFSLGSYLLEHRKNLVEQLRLGSLLLRLPSDRAEKASRAVLLDGALHSRHRDREAISYHYDLSNAFYALWLDPRMVYSCAYYRHESDDLETAQLQKLDLVCRKLGLKPGERFLDMGCGWGGLVMHAASTYGVDATGFTLSQSQADWATQQIEKRGLADRCRVLHLDYRALPDDEIFDKIACVGMFEHVGEANLLTCLTQVWKHLRPGGAFLQHGITRDFHRPVPKASFVTHYVFPDGDLQPISTIHNAAEQVGFEIRDLDNLREHYARTCHTWVERLEANRHEALQYVDEVTFRIWKLYMAGSAYMFRDGPIGLYQTLMVRRDERGGSGQPLNREQWYRGRD